jgi:hypothetical protein
MTAIESAKNVETRLRYVRLLWEEAAQKYFEPEAFTIALQNCITTARAVTFILQANKASFDDFEDWYAVYQNRWRADPVMRWSVEARNAIEKRGDLEKLSQVQASIVASYLGGPVSSWVPAGNFVSIAQVYRSIPKDMLVPHVLEHGTLILERRWVDSALPDVEVLEAMAKVYRELAGLVKDLLMRVGESERAAQLEVSPPIMSPVLMDRAIYVSLKDGRSIGYRVFSTEITGEELRTAAKRYEKFADWSGLPKAATFEESCDIVFKHARGVVLRDHYHRSIALLFTGRLLTKVVGLDFPDRASKYVMVRELARLAVIVGADGVMLIGEAWGAKSQDVPPSGFASEATERMELLTMSAASSAGQSLHYEARMIRKRIKRHRIKDLGVTRKEEAFLYIVSPFQKEWGCLDMAALERSEEDLRKSGIELLSDQISNRSSDKGEPTS